MISFSSFFILGSVGGGDGEGAEKERNLSPHGFMRLPGFAQEIRPQQNEFISFSPFMISIYY